MRRYVLDTDVYIRAARDEDFNQELQVFVATAAPFLHFHSVVALELLAGARGEAARRRLRKAVLEPAERRGRMVTPSHGAWQRAGVIVSELLASRKLSPNGVTRSMINDCLLAASSREAGVTIVTQNVRDFERIAHVADCDYAEVWPAV